MKLSELLLSFCLLVSTNGLCLSVNGYDINDVNQLKIDLFNNTNYDTSVRPIFNQSKALQVQVQLGISSILDIDFLTETLFYTGYILARWQDEKLIWNSTHYGGLTKLKLDIALIWNPDIVQLDMVGEFASTTFAYVENTGMVTMVTNRELHSLCEYIYNHYECSVVLFSANNPSSEVNIVPLKDSVNLVNFKMNDTWLWGRTSVSPDTIHLAEVFGTNIEINGLVYNIRVISATTVSAYHKYTPLFLIHTTCLFSCFVPLNSGERVSFSVTVFLALVFLQALITDELPKHSSKLSPISIFMTITLVQSTLSVLISGLLCQLSNRDKDKPIPNWLYKLTNWCKFPDWLYKLTNWCKFPDWLYKLTTWCKCNRRKPCDVPNSVEQGSNCGSAIENDNEAKDTPNTGNRVRELEITRLDAAKKLDLIFACVQWLFLAVAFPIVSVVQRTYQTY